MSADRREIFKVSKQIARELGIGKVAFRLFLLGTPSFTLATVGSEDIRRSLKYADEVVGHKEHTALVPSILMLTK
jgi:hypothetical protein